MIFTLRALAHDRDDRCRRSWWRWIVGGTHYPTHPPVFLIRVVRRRESTPRAHTSWLVNFHNMVNFQPHIIISRNIASVYPPYQISAQTDIASARTAPSNTRNIQSQRLNHYQWVQIVGHLCSTSAFSLTRCPFVMKFGMVDIQRLYFTK